MCRIIGAEGMLFWALHPTSTLARAPCFAAEDGWKETELADFMFMRLKSLDMNSSLPGYDEQLYERL